MAKSGGSAGKGSCSSASGKSGGLETRLGSLSGISFKAGAGYSVSPGIMDIDRGYLINSPSGYAGMVKDPIKGYLNMAQNYGSKQSSYGSSKVSYGTVPVKDSYRSRNYGYIKNIFEKNDEFFKKKYKKACPLCGGSSSVMSGYNLN